MNLRTLDRQKKKLEANIKTINEEIRATKQRQRFRCSKCSRITKLANVIFIQTHWYESPYGCTGGDNWYSGEIQLACPKCGVRHRLINETKTGLMAKLGLDMWSEDLFKNVVYTYISSFYGRGEVYIKAAPFSFDPKFRFTEKTIFEKYPILKNEEWVNV